MNKFKKNGFTLIEVLVVIGIIGVLASIILVALNGGKVKARDARREADLKNIQQAIDLFTRETGMPPGPTNGVNWWAQLSNACAGWRPDPYIQLQPAYFNQLPEDPLSPGAPPQCTTADGYWYYYGRGFHWDGTSLTQTNNSYQYVICTKLESSNSNGYKVIPNIWNGAWTLNYCLSN